MSDANVPVVAGKTYVALTQPIEQLRELVEANVGTEGIGAFDLERIKVPGSGSTFWLTKDLSGSEVAVKEIDGVILYWKPMRSYWAKDMTDGKSPPDCTSHDGKTGVGNPGGKCAECPFNEWKSDPKAGRGKACKERLALFVLQPDAVIPTLILTPPTSIKAIRSYFMQLATRQIPYFAVKTTIALEKSANADGTDFAKMAPKAAGVLTKEELLAVRSLAEAYKPIFHSVRAEDRTNYEDDPANGSAAPTASEMAGT